MLSISLCVCWPLLYLPLWTVCSSILPILKICAFKIIIELWEFYLFYPGDKSLDQCAINLFFHCKACLWILWVVSIKEIKEQEFKIFMKSKLLFLCFQYFCTLSKKYLPIPKDKCFLCIFPIGFILLVFLFRSTTAPHSRTLAWKILWTEEPGRLQSMGSQRVWHDWASSLSLSTFMHWRRKWHHTPVFLPGESPGRGSLVGCRLWGRTESDATEATQQQPVQETWIRSLFGEDPTRGAAEPIALLSLCSRAQKPQPLSALEPRLHKRSPYNEKLEHCNEELLSLAATREKTSQQWWPSIAINK